MIFSLLSIIAFVWIVFGTPAGIAFGMMASGSKNEAEKKKYTRISYIGFGGIAMLMALLIAYMIFTFVAAATGNDQLLPSELETLK